MMIAEPIVRYLTQNINTSGRGIRTRLDAVRELEGVEEILADFRGESKKVELIGTKEGVAKAKEVLDQLASEIAEKMTSFEIDQYKVGRLLGKRGGVVGAIEEKFGVMFHIPRTDRTKQIERGAKVLVSIIGESPSDLEAAREDAEKEISDN